jgi:hypothetical protein
MDQNLANAILAITSGLSVILAITAAIIAVRTEIRAQKRFETDLKHQEKLTAASIKPIVAIFTSEFMNNKGIILSNAGTGTAVITFIEFSKNNRTAKSMPMLFNLPGDFKWDNYWSFGENKHYLKDGISIDLIRLSSQNLREQLLGEDEIERLLNSWQAQMYGITIKIKYEDMLGNSQEEYTRTL